MRNTPVRRLATLALLSAAAVVLCLLVRFPIFPSAPWLEYDAGDIPLIFSSFLYGPWWGLAVTAVACVIQGLTVSAGSGWIGIVMHLCATGALVVAAGLIYRKRPKQSLAAMVIGAVIAILLMLPLNLIFTPLYGTPIEAVKQMLFPVILPFNAIKFGVNAVVAWLLYKPLQSFLQNREK